MCVPCHPNFLFLNLQAVRNGITMLARRVLLNLDRGKAMMPGEHDGDRQATLRNKDASVPPTVSVYAPLDSFHAST